MIKVMALALACMLCLGSAVVTHAEEKEKIKVENKKDGSWKMKVERKGDKEWVGIHEGHEYRLRGDHFKDAGEYTVYGTIGDDNTYITTTRAERIEAAREAAAEANWRMNVHHRGNDWVGIHDGKTYILRGDHFKDDGEYTVYGSIGDDNTYITTTRAVRVEVK